MSGEKTSRRDALKLVGGIAAGLVVGGIAGYLGGQAAVPAKTVTVKETETETITETVTKTITASPTTAVAPPQTVTVTKTLTTTTVAPTAGPPKYTFYIVSHGSPASLFFGFIIKGMEDAAKFLNVRASYYGPVEYSLEKYVDMVESAVAAKPDGIALTLPAPEAVDPIIRPAIEEGIPVIAINTPDMRPPEERIPYMCFVGMDQYKCGVVAAERLLKEYPNPKHALVGNQMPGHIGLETRAKGFMDTLKERGISSEQVDITKDLAKAIEIMKSYLEAHPETDVIFSPGGLGTVAIGKLIETYNLKGKVWGLGVDDIPETLRPVHKGYIICAIGQQPYLQGFLPIVLLYLYKEGGRQVMGNIETGPFVVDKSNVEWLARIKYPDKADWILGP